MYVQEDSCPDYMIKAEECLKQEEERVTNYLHMDTKPKLLKEVEQEILEHYEQELLEKEHSGAAALMRDDKVRPATMTSGTSSALCYYCTQQAFIPYQSSRHSNGRVHGVQGNVEDAAMKQMSPTICAAKKSNVDRGRNSITDMP